METYTTIKKKNQRIETICHCWLGLQQLALRPFYNIVTVGLIALFVLVWKRKSELFAGLPEFMLPLARPLVFILLITAAVSLLLVWVEELGRKTAQKNEGHLIAAFTEKDLRCGHPALLSKKTDKKTGVTIREFYSQIPLSRWEERQDAISDFMNVTMVEPIMYGGKSQNKGYRVVMSTLPGRKPQEKGTLYDDEL